MSAQKGNIFLPLISLVAVLALLAAGYFFYQNQSLKQKELDKRESTPGTVPSLKSSNSSLKIAHWKTWTSPNNSISFKYPPDWEFFYFPEQGEERVGASGSKSGARIGFDVIPNSLPNSKYTPETIADSVKEFLHNGAWFRTGGKIISKENMTVDNLAAVKLVLGESNPKANDVNPDKTINIYVFHNNQITLIQFQADSQSNPLIDQILSTFKFL